VFVLGVDKSGDKVKLSVIYEKIEESDEGSGNPNKKYAVSTEASSSAAALQELKKQFPREIAVSAAEYFLIGEEAAKEGVSKYVDYLSKERNLRLTASVFVVKGDSGRAAEILADRKTLDTLRNYGENAGINAFSSQMAFYELLSSLAKTGNNDTGFAVPALVTFEGNGGVSVRPGGYAIIKNGVLAGFLDDSAARGYNIMKNKSVYSAIEIAGRADLPNSAVKLETAGCNFSFAFNRDKLTEITVNIDIFTSAADYGNSDYSERELNLFAEKEQGRVIYSEARELINASKLYGCDFLRFGDAIRMRHPYKWEKLKDNWDNIYMNTPVRINVNSNISSR